MLKSLIAKSTLAVLAVSAAAFATPPIEKTAPCAPFTRTNFYNGIDVRSYNNLASTTVNISSPPSGGNWSSQPPAALKTLGLIQEPLSPDSSINCVIVPPGLKPQIIASERTPGPVGAKGMAYPLSFNFDERGRAWVVDAVDYPYTHDSSGMPPANSTSGLPTDRLAGRSRILIYEDTDGDGSLDKFKIFYQGFALANSLEFVKGGIIVMVPPSVYYVPRSTTNPDTAGGAPTIVVSGLGSGSNDYDSHGQANSISRGIDNWIYGHTGYNGCGTTGVNVANAPSGSSRAGNCGNGYSYRFKHTLFGSDTSRFEARSGGKSNAHGLSFMEDGQLFKSAATGSSHNQHDARPGVTAIDIRISTGTGRRDRTRLYTLTNDRYYWEGNNDTITATAGSGNVMYYSTGISAVSGSDFYTARLLPQRYWNRFQFACEGMSGLCNMDSLSVSGSSWNSNRLFPSNNASTDRWPNIFASSDAWSAPLMVRTGPDGALWVLDFYNYIFLHNPAQPATNGAFRHPLRYKTRSRIYRILPTAGATDPILNLTNASTSQLVATLFNSNMVWRLHAQRLLIEKGYTTELGTLLENILTTRRQIDAVELDAPVIHAIWTLQGLRQFESNPTRWDPILKNLLLHPAWTVRRNVLLAMPSTEATYAAIREQCAVNDVHAHVRLQALEKLSATPASGAVIESMDGLRIEPHTPDALASTTDNDSSYMTFLSGAFTAAGSTKVTSVTGSARPTTCPAYLAVVGVKGNPGGDKMPYKFQNVHYAARVGGFDLKSNSELTSGEMVVYDLRGQVAFRSVWNQATASWSKSQARNLAQPVYFYTFRGYEGQSFNGRITLSSQL